MKCGFHCLILSTGTCIQLQSCCFYCWWTWTGTVSSHVSSKAGIQVHLILIRSMQINLQIRQCSQDLVKWPNRLFSPPQNFGSAPDLTQSCLWLKWILFWKMPGIALWNIPLIFAEVIYFFPSNEKIVHAKRQRPFQFWGENRVKYGNKGSISERNNVTI